MEGSTERGVRAASWGWERKRDIPCVKSPEVSVLLSACGLDGSTVPPVLGFALDYNTGK